jgi:hypothetical protein
MLFAAVRLVANGVAKFGRYWGKADMPNGFSEGATVKSLKA